MSRYRRFFPFIAASLPGGPTYDPDAQAWFDAVSWGASDLSQKQAVNDFIVALKDGGVWSLWDRLWLIANRDQTAGMTCLKSLAAMTPVNAPTFTQWRGVNGNGSSSYVNTGFVSSADGVSYALNDAAVALDIIGPVAAQNNWSDVGGGSAGYMQIVARWGDNTFAGDVNNSQAAAVGTNNNSAGGLFLAQRTASNAVASYRDNSAVFSGSAASTSLPAIALYLGCRNNGGTPQNFTTRQYALLGFGASLDSGQRSALQAARDALKTAIGW